MMRRRRSAYGRRTMLLTRSSGIVELVCASGTVPPSGIRSGDEPGWQSTKYSPMNDWGRISQCASRRRSAKPGSVTLAVTIACLRGPALTRRSFVVPALTPATLKSPPSDSPKALSKAIS